jgi:hypothetical protein
MPERRQFANQNGRGCQKDLLGTNVHRGRAPVRFANTCLVVGYSDCFRSGLLVLCGKLRRTEFKGQLIDRAFEREWRLIVLIVHSSAGIYTDVKGLIRSLNTSAFQSLQLRVREAI